MKYSELPGWKPTNPESNDVAHAIYYLEKNFEVCCDQRYGSDVDNLFNMNTQNHHMKSLAHSPSIVGLFFSLLKQFTSTATFVDNGKLFTIKTDLFKVSLSRSISEFWRHGSLCILDLSDAAIRFGGFRNPVESFRRGQ